LSNTGVDESVLTALLPPLLPPSIDSIIINCFI